MKGRTAGLRTSGSMIIGVLLLSTLSCSTLNPCKIGFMGSFTGGVSDISIAARNGVILAIEEVNRTGGISGRRLELLIMDDRGDPESAMRGMEYFDRERVVGVVGPVTAEMARVAAPLAELKRIMMISPTANSADFPERGDFFLPGFPGRQKRSADAGGAGFYSKGISFYLDTL